MKNILLIIPELGGGGAENTILKLSMLLAQRYKVNLCVFHTIVEVPYPVSINLIDLSTPPTQNILRKLYYTYFRTLSLRRLKKKYGVDVSISFLEGANYINILSKHQDKVITSIRGSKSHDKQIGGILGTVRKKVLIPLLYRKADIVATASKGLELEMKLDYRLHQESLITIPNFYEINQICKQASERLEEKHQQLFDRPVIIHSGRFHPQKEHLKLLTVFRHVIKKIKCRLILLGDGALRLSTVEYAQELGFSVSEGMEAADVCFLGFQDNPFQFIAKANLFIFTSSWEGFPNALAEAMICGTPVISTDCPTGPRELLAPDTDVAHQTIEPEETPCGWLMPLLKDQSAIDQWIQTIVYLLENPEAAKAKSMAAQQRMKAFSQEKVARQWFDLIERV